MLEASTATADCCRAGATTHGKVKRRPDAVLAWTGVTAASFAADGEYDLVLKCAEHAGAVRHVPKLLCMRGGTALDTPEQERAALQRMTERRKIAASVAETPIAGTWRLQRSVQTSGLVSIIIPTCAAGGFIKTCLNSLRAKTTYENYEIIVIDNIPAAETGWKTWVREHADRVVDIPDSFNWSIFNNRAARVAKGEFLLFLNDDITITQPDWLEALLEHAQRPEVGIVGPQLLYPDGKVQHAGKDLLVSGHAGSIDAVDWNGDGRKDLIISGESGWLYYFERSFLEDNLPKATAGKCESRP